ncbi:MAG: hypothetical protein ABEI39_05300 [Halobacteriales archaeon]
MSLAAETRAEVRERPFLLAALRAGVVNYAAAARELDVADDEAAVATALRRFAEDLPERSPGERSATVTMRSGLAPADDGVLSVGGAGFAAENGEHTGLLATGDVDARALEFVLGRLRAEGIGVAAAGVADGSLLVVVGRRDGADALRIVEAALDRVPDDPTV